MRRRRRPSLSRKPNSLPLLYNVAHAHQSITQMRIRRMQSHPRTRIIQRRHIIMLHHNMITKTTIQTRNLRHHTIRNRHNRRIHRNLNIYRRMRTSMLMTIHFIIPHIWHRISNLRISNLIRLIIGPRKPIRTLY